MQDLCCKVWSRTNIRINIEQRHPVPSWRDDEVTRYRSECGMGRWRYGGDEPFWSDAEKAGMRIFRDTGSGRYPIKDLRGDIFEL